MRKVKPKPRKVRSTEEITSQPKRPATIVVETSHAHQILHLPLKQREIVIRAIKEGNSVSDIARFFSEQGLLRVTENTFKQYLFAFKRIFPEMCEGNDDTSIDSIVDGKRPQLDEEMELERLVRLQKVRLKVGVDFERNTGFLNNELHKDIKATGELIEKLASIRGRTKGAGRPSAHNVATTPAAAEALRSVDVGEAAQERLVSAVSGLVSLVKRSNDTNSSQS